MGKSEATGRWTGGLKSGRGVMKPGHAAEVPFGAATRFEGQPGSNPEELIGAALSGCYAMALAAALEKAGAEPSDVQTQAAVQLERKDGGFAIGNIALSARVAARGIDEARFQRIAQETKSSCPVGKALSNVPINLSASLLPTGDHPAASAPL
jgi:lipoyl-dependent peroxiredoxin